MTLLLAFRNCLRNPRRSITVMITVGFGVFSLFIYDGFNHGIMNQYRENTIHARYGNGQFFTPGYREQVFEKPWEHWIEYPKPVMEFLKSQPGVLHVFPRIEFYALLTNGNITLSGRGQGIDGPSEAEFFHTLNIEDGKAFVNETDGLLLGKGLAKSLGAKIGDTITILGNTVYGSINGVDLRVTGIFHTGAKEFDDVAFRLPIAAAQKLLDTDRVEGIALGLKSVEHWDPIVQAVKQSEFKIEGIPFAVLDKVYYQHAVDWLASQFQMIKSIILLIVVLGIFNTIATGIFERKQEVGNLRANGESQTVIARLFLLECLILGLAGAVSGIVLAYLTCVTVLSPGILMPPSPGLTRQFHVWVELRWSGLWECFGWGIITTALGSSLAILRIIRIPIAQALRSV